MLRTTSRSVPFGETQHSLRRTVEPVGFPVSVSEVRRHLGLGEDSETELEIEDLLPAAVSTVETHARIALLEQTWELTMDRFPRLIELWRPPIRQVVSVKYFDPDGDEKTLDSADYEVDTKSRPGRILPVHEKFWPETDVRMNAVTVEFEAGFDTVPWAAKLAVILAIKCPGGEAFESYLNQISWGAW